jgi:hypothetical protein
VAGEAVADAITEGRFPILADQQVVGELRLHGADLDRYLRDAVGRHGIWRRVPNPRELLRCIAPPSRYSSSAARPRSRSLYNRVEFGWSRWTFRRREASSEDLTGLRGRSQSPCQGEGRGFESSERNQLLTARRWLRDAQRVSTDARAQGPGSHGIPTKPITPCQSVSPGKSGERAIDPW